MEDLENKLPENQMRCGNCGTPEEMKKLLKIVAKQVGDFYKRLFKIAEENSYRSNR